jgi:hypothetical protein
MDKAATVLMFITSAGFNAWSVYNLYTLTRMMFESKFLRSKAWCWFAVVVAGFATLICTAGVCWNLWSAYKFFFH